MVLAAMVIVVEKEAVMTTTSSRENRPWEKWTLWSSPELLCWASSAGPGQECVCRVGHILEEQAAEAGERLIVLWGVSVKRARRMNDLLIGSLLHFPTLCFIQTVPYFGVSRWCVDILITEENLVSQYCSDWRCTPSCSAVLFPLKSFHYFFCILAALSMERYIPLLE